MTEPAIVWFRQDLRLRDNPALVAAAKTKRPILPIYIYEEKKVGEAQKVWLYHSLKALLKKMPLVLLKGDPKKILPTLPKGDVFANRCYEPGSLNDGITTFKANLLVEPWEISFYKVFTPYWKACLKIIEPEKPLPKPTLHFYTKLKGDDLEAWELLPKHPNWAKKIESFWTMTEEGAHERLEAFIETALTHYDHTRDIMALDGTSRLSPYLHFGQISPKQIRHRVIELKGSEPFLRELGWREFSYHLLHHFPKLPSKPFREAFDAFEWNKNKKHFDAWTQGMTGYPIVDAAMRQLWAIGWMHNRARMIVASFLTKDLFIPWQKGAEWFWQTLVDADLANNSASWQWVAGSGADAAPYFRIFNPILQGKKFDPEGIYIKQWVPELRDVDPKHIHEPWDIPNLDYPKPIVDHRQARQEALKRFEKIKK